MLYVVFVRVDNAHNEAWFRWMRDEHIADVMSTDCFSSATFVRDSERDTREQTAYRIVYCAHSENSFRRYQADFGDALRAEHTERFGEVTDAHRELLPILMRHESDT